MQQLPTTHSGSLRWTDLTDEDIQHIIDEEIPPTLGDDKCGAKGAVRTDHAH
jgi:hypothetical protein